jgi:hypothetical protein
MKMIKINNLAKLCKNGQAIVPKYFSSHSTPTGPSTGFNFGKSKRLQIENLI